MPQTAANHQHNSNVMRIILLTLLPFVLTPIVVFFIFEATARSKKEIALLAKLAPSPKFAFES